MLLLFVSTQPRNLASLRQLMQQRREVVHQRQFGLGARLPAQAQRGHEFAQAFAVEDAATEHFVYEDLQRGGGKIVPGGDGGECARFLLGLEALVTGADCLFFQLLAQRQAADVFGNIVAFVDELGIGLDEADQLLAVHGGLAGLLRRHPGDEAHDVVVVDEAGGEQHELEIELLYFSWCLLTFFRLLLFQALGGFEIGAAEAL